MWEYFSMIKPGTDRGTNKCLNELACQGWELVTVDLAVLFFKRKVN